MTDKKGFGNSKKRTPPPVSSTHGALDAPAPKVAKIKKIDSTVTVTIRTTPDTKKAIKRYSYENEMPMGEVLETAMDILENGNLLAEKKSPLQ